MSALRAVIATLLRRSFLSGTAATLLAGTVLAVTATFLSSTVATLLVSTTEQAVSTLLSSTVATLLASTTLAIASTLLSSSTATLLVSSTSTFLCCSALLAGITTVLLRDTIVATKIHHAIEKLESVCVGASQTKQASRE
ncbi:MAG TPA: hypothetical protein VMM76_28155 [Pirellulaceae bacterium]|nr:hypothetical protein [Pirellulaceae bacterium]